MKFKVLLPPFSLLDYTFLNYYEIGSMWSPCPPCFSADYYEIEEIVLRFPSCLLVQPLIAVKRFQVFLPVLRFPSFDCYEIGSMCLLFLPVLLVPSCFLLFFAMKLRNGFLWFPFAPSLFL